MRRASRRDKNHAEIRDGLRQLGFGVIDTASFGDTVGDLLVCKAGLTWVVEVKNPKAYGKEKPHQAANREDWQHRGGLWIVAESLEGAIEQIDAILYDDR